MTNLLRILDRTVSSMDPLVTRVQLALREARGTLVSLYFHGLFLDEQESRRGLWDPQQGVTVEHFRRCIEHFLAAGYRFATPPELLGGLDPAGRHVLLTFDDGYYNNVRALPILEEYGVSALFFISTEHVRTGRAFWWDVVHRAGVAAGRSPRELYAERQALKGLRAEEIELAVSNAVGGPLVPVGDADRPFRPEELRDFARHRHVFIGNHTCNHAVLANYDAPGVMREIAGAQDALEEMTGSRPVAIGYPNGAHDALIAHIAQQAGLQLGFTTEPRKEHVGDVPRRRMVLGRFCPWGNDSLDRQCRDFRSDVAMGRLYGRWKQRVKRAVGGRA